MEVICIRPEISFDFCKFKISKKFKSKQGSCTESLIQSHTEHRDMRVLYIIYNMNNNYIKSPELLWEFFGHVAQVDQRKLHRHVGSLVQAPRPRTMLRSEVALKPRSAHWDCQKHLAIGAEQLARLPGVAFVW